MLKALSRLRKRALCSYVEPKRDGIVTFKNHAWFAAQKITLHDVEQKAIIAHFALEYILQFRPSKYLNGYLSIREGLIDENIFSSFILSEINQSISKREDHYHSL